MAGLVRRKPFGQIFPPSATSQDPEDAVHYFAAVLPRSAASVFPARRFRDEKGDDRPLFISQFFSSCHRFSLARPFIRWLLGKSFHSLTWLRSGWNGAISFSYIDGR